MKSIRTIKYIIAITTVMFALLLSECKSKGDDLNDGQPKPVSKTNPMKVYMHYMPWFQSKPVSGYWGIHWRMSNKNPDIVDGDGKRQIASHYYPLIGPYDTNDQNVIEYHLLLMKYTGVDGILIDWYGSHPVNDYGTNLKGTNAVVKRLTDVGLQFAIVYEEVTAQSVFNSTHQPAIEAAKDDMKYLTANYFGKKEYIRVNNNPLLLTFGPRYFTSESQWNEILGALSVDPVFLPLWFNYEVGKNSDGQFAWVDFNNDLSDQTKFYGTTGIGMKMTSAFPRFHDFYAEGGWGTSYGYVDSNSGQTLKSTLTKAKESQLGYVQLVTWNDFGEGTVVEPTLEDQYSSLEAIQAFTGVPYTKAELELIFDYYQKKVKYKDDSASLTLLLKAFHHLAALEVDQAKDILSQLQ